MINQTIALSVPKVTTFYKETPFCLKKEPPRFRRLSKMMWSLLSKIGALEPYREKVETWTYTEAKASGVNDALVRCMESVKIRGERVSDYAFLMGVGDFRDLTDSPHFDRSVSFRTGPFEYNGRCFNIPIHVVPNLSGVAIVPKAAIEKRA